MRDRFDVFLEALKYQFTIGSSAENALEFAIKMVEQADVINDLAEQKAMEDIHYEDRYGKE